MPNSYQFLKVFLRTKNQQLCCLAVMAHIALSKRRIVTTKIENQLVFWKIFSSNHNQVYKNLFRERQKSFRSLHKRVDSPLIYTVNQTFICLLFLYTFNLHNGSKFFSVSNDGVDWSSDFGPDSVTLTVKNLVRDKTIKVPEKSLWQPRA